MDPVQNDLNLLGIKQANGDGYNIHIPPLPRPVALAGRQGNIWHFEGSDTNMQKLYGGMCFFFVFLVVFSLNYLCVLHFIVPKIPCHVST